MVTHLSAAQAKPMCAAAMQCMDYSIDCTFGSVWPVTGKTSVPQVFVKGQFIGGCNDGGLGGTVPLLKSGKLQEMLK